MKRILTILLIVMMVFSITGCDPEGRAGLASFMDKMGQNVMGTDTSKVDKLVAETEVKTEDLQPVVKESKTNSDGIKVDVIEFAPDVKVELTEEESKKVEKTLPPIQSSTIENIGKNLTNKESKEKFVLEMKAEPDTEVKKAAQGSATIMKAALTQITSTLPTDKVPEAVKESLKTVSDSLITISDDPSSVSKADVVTLQLVNDFVAVTSKPANVEAIKKGEVPEEVLSGANNLFTITSALSEASKFNPNTLIGAVVAAVPAEGQPKNVAKALSRDGESAADGKLSEIKVSGEVQTFINVAYDAIQNVIGGDNFAQTKSGLGFHKMSYENYANMVAGKVKLSFENPNETAKKIEVKYNYDAYLDTAEFENFKVFAGVAQYVVATAFSEGDDYYQAFLEILETGKYNDQTVLANPIDTKDFAKNIRDFILDFATVNKWVSEPTKNEVNVVVPEKYAGLLDLDPKEFSKLAMALMTGRDLDENVIPGHKQYFRVAMNTLNNMLVFTDISSISSAVGDMDLNYMLYDAIQRLYINPPAETGNN